MRLTRHPLCLILSLCVLAGCRCAPGAGPAAELADVRASDGPPEGEADAFAHADVAAVAAVDAGRLAEPPPLELPALNESDVHRSAVVVDLHVDTLWQMHAKRRRPDHPKLEASPAHLAAGGVDVQFFSVWVPPEDPTPQATALGLIDLFEAKILAPSGDRHLARSASEALALVKDGKKVAMLGLEGAVPLRGDPLAVDLFHARGVRYVALTWNERNPFGAGARQLTGGLTTRGETLIRRLNELRLTVDVSHANPDTFWGVLTHSRRPVIASHSNAWAVHPHPRNLNDVQLWAVAESGGVVGLNFHGRFVGPGRRGTLPQLVRHASHIQRVGPALPALGTDFDGQISTPRGLRTMAGLPALTEALAGAGWPAGPLEGLLGHNVLRTMHQVETGQARRAVTHRPAAFSSVTATANPLAASAAFDTVLTTGWEAPADEPTGHVLSLTAIGPDVERVTLCGSTTTRRSGVRKVEIRARDGAGTMLHTVQVGLTADLRPHRVELPDAARAAVIHLDIELVDVSGGPALLAEVVAERRVRPTLLEGD